MDSLDTKAAARNLQPSNRKRKTTTEDEPLSLSKRALFYATVCHQNFAFPDSTMYYIAMKPATSKVYQKIIKACKYFFIKNPIITYIAFYYDGIDWQESAHVWQQKPDSSDLKKFTSKFWVMRRLCVNAREEKNQNIISSLIPKLYRFAVKDLSLSNQVITLKEYDFLACAAEYIFLYKTAVKNKNGTFLPLETIFQIPAKVNAFIFTSDTTLSNITSKTSKELFGNPKFFKLKYFSLNHIPNSFDIEVFYTYIQKNKHTTFNLKFDDTVSDAYKNRLDAIVDEILAGGTLDSKPRFIHFQGIDIEKYRRLGFGLVNIT